MKPLFATLRQTARNRLAAVLLTALVLGNWALDISAAVVTGTIVDTTGTALVTTVVFQPLSNPQADAGIVITAGPKSVTTGTNGTFSVTLEQGDYTVLIRGRDQFTIAVPNDATTNNVTTLTTDSLTYVYTADPGQYPSATENVNGGVKTDVYSADPVVYLKSSLDALLATNAAPSKLDITNGTAVNLTGSLTNVSVFGPLVIDSGDELQDTVDYSLALTPNGNTPTENDATPRPQSVATIASLVADVDPLLVPTYARVNVLGYTVAGDGGGGDFRRVLYSSVSGTTGDGGMWFQSSNNPLYAWARVWSGEPVSVSWFGATGDGVTDDTVAVQGAIDFAETPSYGPGSTGANANTAPVEFVAGEYVLSQIVINKLSELRGIAGQKVDVNNGTVLKQKAGFVGPLISITPAGSSWSFRKPFLHGFVLLGQAEQNATNHVPITASASRVSFTVATNFLPEYNSAALTWPFFGHCFFYGPSDGGTRRYMGSGWVESIDYTNGTVTLRDQTDWYATPLTNGLSLGTNMAVIFSPLRTNGTWVGYSGAYAPAGNAGIWIEGTGNSRIENINMEKFHCGIVTADTTAFIPLADFFIGRSQFFNLGAYRAGVNSDSMASVGYLQGFYRTDYALPDATLAVTNSLYRRTVFNLFNPGYGDDYSQITLDSALVNHFQARATDVQITGGLNDNAIVGAIWLDGINSMTNAFRYSGKTIRSPFLTSPTTEGSSVLNTTNATFVLKSTSAAFASASFDALSVHGVYAYLNNDTNASPAPKYDFGFILPASSYVNIGALDDIQGLTTIKSGAGTVNWGAVRNEVTTASDAGGNWYFPTATSIAYAPATTELFKIASTGVSVGYSAMTDTPLAITGGASGNAWLSFTRSSGSSQTYSLRGATNVFRVYDDTAAVDALYVVSTSAGRQLYIGSGGGSATPAANSDLLSERGSGTDVAGTTLSLVGDYSTGSANNANAIRLRYGVAGSSGTTLQSLADGLVLEGDGDVTIPTTGATLTVGGVPVALVPTVGTLSYSGSDVTVTAGKGPLQEDTLTCAGNFNLLFTGLAARNAGTILVWPAATNCTVTLPSYAYGPSGTTLTISGGTGYTNHTEIAWMNTVVGGTNRVSINALNYYR